MGTAVLESRQVWSNGARMPICPAFDGWPQNRPAALQHGDLFNRASRIDMLLDAPRDFGPEVWLSATEVAGLAIDFQGECASARHR